MKTGRYSFNLKHSIIAVAFILFSAQAYSQNDAVGVRLGSDPGITWKHYFAGNGGTEVLLHTGYRGVMLTGLYEWHLPFGTPGLQGYLGVGAHFGAGGRYIRYRNYRHEEIRVVYVDGRGPSFGPDGIMGIEYRIPKAPVDVAFDIHPGMDFYPRNTLIGTFNAAFSIRYRF